MGDVNPQEISGTPEVRVERRIDKKLALVSCSTMLRVVETLRFPLKVS